MNITETELQQELSRAKISDLDSELKPLELDFKAIDETVYDFIGWRNELNMESKKEKFWKKLGI